MLDDEIQELDGTLDEEEDVDDESLDDDVSDFDEPEEEETF